MQRTSRRVPASILALGLGAFGIGTTEFAPMGLLPAISQDLGSSISVTGQIVTAYAIGVMIGAPIMTWAMARWSHRTSLMALMGLFVVGNLLSAIATGYWSLMLGRVVTSLSQGAFFGSGAVVATSVVPPERQGSAVATMFMGLSIANILGVPAAAWLGDAVGWRSAFGGTAALGVIALVALGFTLPRDGGGNRPNLAELKALSNRSMLLTISATVLFAGSFFSVYTYIAPLLATIAEATPSYISLLLAIIGIGLTAGNWIGGKLANGSLRRAISIGLGAQGLSSLVLPLGLSASNLVPTMLILWAAAAFASVPGLQMRAMQAARQAPSIAAALNIAAFNLGNAVGAGAGGMVLAAGFGVEAVPIVAAALAGLGLLIVRLDAN
ncbi:MFS transporter [Celeribacter litoreus]|uniref:MFS transporter n=1 Tax=Celeribacter litoreus TaxID=2876714 RepID=UPI001CCE02D7|nr:MFS transporter [Celeribacter litoreus]MCA0041988.1 MFS transporter [Celeribacter litoreus]